MRWLVNTRGALFALLLLVMTGHESEHVAQMVQKYVLHAHCPQQCRGLLGFIFDVEWIHFVYNVSIFLLLAGLFLAYRLWEPHWRRQRPFAWASLTAGIFLFQGYHIVEHSVKFEQWLRNGHHGPTKGLLGQLLPWHGITLIELHFALNTLVFVAVVCGYFGLGLHHEARAGRRAVLRASVALAAVVSAVAAPAQALAVATESPTVRLESGWHHGTIVIDRPQKLVGRPGTIVHGGIVIKASNVTVRNVHVLGGIVIENSNYVTLRNVGVDGGQNGIDVEFSRNVTLDRVSVAGAELDGIHVRRSAVTIKNCTIDSPSGFTQGIDISFAIDLPMSVVQGCTVRGGREGIVTHSAMVLVRDNHVQRTALRGIAMTEMSMGEIEQNHVTDALGVGVYCGDHSECEIARNTIANTRPDAGSEDLSRIGYPIVAFYWAQATLENNTIVGSKHGAAQFAQASIARDD